MMLYKNTKVKVRSLDRDTDYFASVAGVQQGNTLTPYLFIISLDYVLRTSTHSMKENCFKLAKERRRIFAAPTITGVGYTDDIALLANSPAQTAFKIHSLKWAAGDIGPDVNAYKTKYISFNKRGDISTLKGGPLKLVNKFTYLRSSVSSTDNDINKRQTKAWKAIDRLSVIW